MSYNPKDDRAIMKAVEAQNRGAHATAAALFRQAGNQYRKPSEKTELRKAAARSERIAESD